jgi:hypothetical protein
MEFRFFCGTGGIMSSIMKLIRHSAHKAIETGIEKITLELLEEAYEEELAADDPEVPNPFSTTTTKLKIFNEENELAYA